ncbi:hypothetical protein ALQ05_200232 [Pseudomonas amygdali pv. mori]|uniref:Uncharacterized protein n=1 Tax=Pseudomonas amygdali pv. mori TaxID=34065 RepID=A0A3M4L2Z8_PSEA0|nr:hypothetical protein ALQ05_200232 [Pseudomonas amygdali pv. mori]
MMRDSLVEIVRIWLKAEIPFACRCFGGISGNESNDLQLEATLGVATPLRSSLQLIRSLLSL